MAGARRCRCGGELVAATASVPVALSSCRVEASVVVPALRCAACGLTEVEPGVAALARLAVARALADQGVCSGGALRHMRKALGLRACEIARLLGVTPETISHWETGRAATPRAAFATLGAMVDDAVAGRTATRDRLAVLAADRPHPRSIAVSLVGDRRR